MKNIYTYGSAQKLYSPFKVLERHFEIKLKVGHYYILSFDGKEMTAGFKIKHQAINDIFFKTMRECFYNFVNTYDKILFAYSFSDEISILFKSKKSDTDFSRSEKLLSLLSSQLTLVEILVESLASKSHSAGSQISALALIICVDKALRADIGLE